MPGENEFARKLRNQVVGIVIAASITGLSMNFLFISNINLRIKELERRFDKLEDHYLYRTTSLKNGTITRRLYYKWD